MAASATRLARRPAADAEDPPVQVARRRDARPDGVWPLRCGGQVVPLQAGRARVAGQPAQPQPPEHRCQPGFDGDDAEPTVGVSDQLDLADPAAMATITVEDLDVEQISHQQEIPLRFAGGS